MYIIKLKRIIQCLCVIMVLSLSSIWIVKNWNVSKQTVSSRYQTYQVVIDAGHGGMDGGATGTTLGTLEKELNLKISEKVYLLMNLLGIPAVQTREQDISLNYNPELSVKQNKSLDLNARLHFIDKLYSPLFISIHMNKFEQSRYKGAQVFYSANHSASKLLGEYLQKSLIEQADPSNARICKQAESGIFLMKHLKCPAVIVECGFLSNPNEEILLNENHYQKKIAAAIVNGYMDFLFSEN